MVEVLYKRCRWFLDFVVGGEFWSGFDTKRIHREQLLMGISLELVPTCSNHPTPFVDMAYFEASSSVATWKNQDRKSCINDKI